MAGASLRVTRSPWALISTRRFRLQSGCANIHKWSRQEKHPAFQLCSAISCIPSSLHGAADRFIYTVLGDRIQLDIAYVDLPEAREAIEKTKAGAEGTVQMYVTDRFSLTPEAALGLLMTATELVKALRQFGKLPAVEENAVD
jgi:hypothetical protein